MVSAERKDDSEWEEGFVKKWPLPILMYYLSIYLVIARRSSQFSQSSGQDSSPKGPSSKQCSQYSHYTAVLRQLLRSVPKIRQPEVHTQIFSFFNSKISIFLPSSSSVYNYHLICIINATSNFELSDFWDNRTTTASFHRRSGWA